MAQPILLVFSFIRFHKVVGSSQKMSEETKHLSFYWHDRTIKEKHNVLRLQLCHPHDSLFAQRLILRRCFSRAKRVSRQKKTETG